MTAMLVFVVYGCATTAPRGIPAETMRGVASWYGEEFAGRTTANGEIFDPLALTAAHRTLPFGTLLDVRNVKTNDSVRVRINDRGPYVGNRVIDLSYAAAQQIGLIEPGTGEVELKVIKVGKGDREPPAPYVVTIDEPREKVVISSSEPPPVEFPLPPPPPRKTVAADGLTIMEGERVVQAAPAPAPPSPVRLTVKPKPPRFIVQVGAFSVEANAKALQQRLTRIGQRAEIDRDELYRVRLGPFETREEALRARTQLEASGLSAIIVTE
jgi:rare lipoprotein A